VKSADFLSKLVFVSDDEKPLIYHGGPLDGERVKLVGTLMPAEIGNRKWPDGRYVFNHERDRYEWRLGTRSDETR
jgi:hypothetical protein